VPDPQNDRSTDPANGRAAATEEQIQAYTVGEIQPLTAPIALVDYDPEWPVLFAREEARIRIALGDRIIRLEHTGSTSVPGLAAKPIIDMTMIVADVADEPAYVSDLEAAGYVLRIRESEPDWYDHRVFKGPDTNVNLHVFSAGCVELERMVGLRDWLRTHDDDRELYEATKRELIKRDWKYVQNYADAKGEVVEAIATRAGLPGPHAQGGPGPRLQQRPSWFEFRAKRRATGPQGTKPGPGGPSRANSNEPPRCCDQTESLRRPPRHGSVRAST
jgi:GrpB-like predicted nucleotidyltransferase (UPF0157 family)